MQRIRCEREKAEKKSGRRARRKPLPPLDTSDLPELPEGWVWVRIGDLCWRITKGSTPTSYGYEYKEHGIRFIRTEDIRVDGSIRDATFFIDEATNEFLARSVLEERDILFSIAGTIGRTGIVQTKCLPANTNQALAIIRGVWSRLYSRFLFHALRCPFVQGQTDALTVGVGRANLSLANVGGLIAPLAPLEEQAKLVSEAERHFSIADAVEKAVEQGLAQAGRLRQSILKRAFEGKLLPQDPSDEPAEKLLERIRAEKQKPARKANGGRMKRP